MRLQWYLQKKAFWQFRLTSWSISSDIQQQIVCLRYLVNFQLNLISNAQFSVTNGAFVCYSATVKKLERLIFTNLLFFVIVVLQSLVRHLEAINLL